MRRYFVSGAAVLLLAAFVVGVTAGVSAAKVRVTPTIGTTINIDSVPVGGRATDTAKVTGDIAGGRPTGSVTFAVCGPTAKRTACTAPNVGSVTVPLSPAHLSDRSRASASLIPGSPGWYCFLDTYNGNGDYLSISDNDPATECVDATGGGTGRSTPTLTTALSSPSIPYGNEAVDTATVTGNLTDGPPTGSVTFSACGPTANPTPCTAPNIGSVTVGLSEVSSDRSVASVIIIPGSTGWFCFLDTYNGDWNYKAVSDNNPATECLDVTGSAGTAGTADGSATPTRLTARGGSARSAVIRGARSGAGRPGATRLIAG